MGFSPALTAVSEFCNRAQSRAKPQTDSRKRLGTTGAFWPGSPLVHVGLHRALVPGVLAGNLVTNGLVDDSVNSLSGTLEHVGPFVG